MTIFTQRGSLNNLNELRFLEKIKFNLYATNILDLK